MDGPGPGPQAAAFEAIVRRPIAEPPDAEQGEVVHHRKRRRVGATTRREAELPDGPGAAYPRPRLGVSDLLLQLQSPDGRSR